MVRYNQQLQIKFHLDKHSNKRNFKTKNNYEVVFRVVKSLKVGSIIRLINDDSDGGYAENGE